MRFDNEPETGENIPSLIRHRDRQIAAIRRVSETLFTHPGTEPMARETLRIALDILGADAGTVYLHDPANDTLVLRCVTAGSGEPPVGTRIPADEGVMGAVFHSGTSHLGGGVPGVGDPAEMRPGFSAGTRMTAPLKRTDAAAIGVLQVRSSAGGAPFGDLDLAVLELLCAQAATGIEHFQLIEAARKTEIVHVIGDVSHDIKNMLTPITTGVQTLEPMLDNLFADLRELREQCGEPVARGIAERIGKIAAAVEQDYGWMLQNSLFAAEQIQARTREIADAIKGETAPPYFETGDLNETCEQVLQTLRAVAAKRGVLLVPDLDPDLPPAQFDRKQMYNALYNLVNNALPETPEGGSVTVRTRPGTPGDTVSIQVADTGGGMPEHIRERLFTDAAVSTKPGGTGLGTRIVWGVVQRHNGTITVESETRVGSTFTIELPTNHA